MCVIQNLSCGYIQSGAVYLVTWGVKLWPPRSCPADCSSFSSSWSLLWLLYSTPAPGGSTAWHGRSTQDKVGAVTHSATVCVEKVSTWGHYICVEGAAAGEEEEGKQWGMWPMVPRPPLVQTLTAYKLDSPNLEHLVFYNRIVCYLEASTWVS